MPTVLEWDFEGGEEGTWIAAGSQCSGNINSCTIEGLPAGTPTMVRVVGGSTGGWGEPSDVIGVKTIESEASESCNRMLLDQANGTYIAPGSIVAIVFGVLAICVLCAAVAFVAKRRTPPPPPAPGAGYDKNPPAY